MKITDVHPTLREAYALFEALRRLGFTSAEISYHLNPADAPSDPGCMMVCLDYGGRSFAARAGGYDGRAKDEIVVDYDRAYDRWKKEWIEFTTAITEGTFTQADLQRCWEESDLVKSGRGLEFVKKLYAKGIVPPRASEVAS